MSENVNDNQINLLEEAIQQFVNLQLRSQNPDIDEFVKKYPGLEDQVRERIHKLKKIDTLLDTLVQTDESDFIDTATMQDLTDQKVGNFEIREMIGRGGMGVVYLARDTKLDRWVAIKRMPAEWQANATARMRFKREAKLLASLNHPNIAVIHDIIEQDDDSSYLVLEYIPGQTLTERIGHKPMKLEAALFVGRQISEALETAHEKGIIHRDLKPGNIKITPDDIVKVLDFGLAKEFGGESSEKPTSITQPGRIVGTPAYMSPEQARGKPTDKRSDIWSFGCILYEMLTGKVPFEGETISDTLANILQADPDWTILSNNTPPTIQLLLRKCLNKDHRHRLHDIADARIDLEQALADPTSSIIRLSDHALQVATARPCHPWWLTTGITVIASLLMAIIVWSLKPDPPAPPSPIRRISMDLGMEGHLVLVTDPDRGTAVRLSPDGSTLAFIARSREGAEAAQIYLRRLDQLEAVAIPSTRGANQFCYSPDGRWIAFCDATENMLKKVAVTGGEATTLCESYGSWDLDWAEKDSIVFDGTSDVGIQRVSAAGGTPETVIPSSEHTERPRLPQTLPGGQAMLFSDHYHYDKTRIMVQRLPQGEPRQIWPKGYNARYVSSGHILFIQAGTLYGVAFDLDSLTLKGQPVPLVEEVESMHFDISQQGSLVYVKHVDTSPLYTVEWVNRAGERQAFLPANHYGQLRLSPTGQYLAYSQWDGRQTDIWIHDLERNFGSRRTFSSSDEFGPVWSPNGVCIAFARFEDSIWNLYWQRSDGSSEARRLNTSRNSQIPDFWHPSGDQIVFWEQRADIESNLRILTLKGDDQSGWIGGETTDFQADPVNEWASRISADGRWIAYCSKESGEDQIYVRPFPSGGGKTQVSLPGTTNTMPIWSRNSSELIFATKLDNPDFHKWQVFLVEYSIEQNSFVPGHPTPWEGAIYHDFYYGGVELHPDGQRLLVRTRADGEVAPVFDRVVLFQNFLDYLRKQVPVN